MTLAALPPTPDKERMAEISDLIAVSINGETMSVPDGITVAALAAHLGLDARKIAVERNREIVPRSTWQTAQLSSGDILEIVHFIGGG